MRRWIAVLALGALLSSCGGASKATQIEPLLIWPDDLPVSDTAGPVKTDAGITLLMYSDLPTDKEMRHQEILRDGQRDGWVSVFLYPSEVNQAAVYREFVSGLGAGSAAVPGLGDRAMGIDPAPGDADDAPDITFTRCGAVVFLRWSGTSIQPAIDYAKRLDQRLMPVLCAP